MIPRSKTDIISAALVRLGESPVASIDEIRTSVRQAVALYDGIRHALLAYPWRFALREQQLTPLPAETVPNVVTPYSNGFALPGIPGVLLPWGLTSRVPFGIYGNQLWCDDDDAYLIFVADLDAPELPPHFAVALETALAAALAIPVTESASKAEYLERQAIRQLRIARAADAQSSWTFSVPLHELMTRWPTPR